MYNILLVEDDTALAMGIEYTLKNENFAVDTANSINSAQGAIANKKYDLIILDVMLPDGSGYDLCQKIRAKLNTPIIFLTACDEEVNVVLGLDMGGDDYITKPFRVRELVSRIKAVLRRHNIPTVKQANKITSGNIKIQPMESRVEKNGKGISLTPAEYKLLLIFINHPKQVLTRDILIQTLWDIDESFVDDNTLSVYIRRLREKLEDDPAYPRYIITVRGFGYRWDQDIMGD